MARLPRRRPPIDLVALRLERLRKAYVWGPRVKVDVRPGVIAFLQPLKACAIPGSFFPKWRSERIKQAKISVFGRSYKLVQFDGGKWEIYRIEADDFTESFLGYDTDVLPQLLRGAYCKTEVSS